MNGARAAGPRPLSAPLLDETSRRTTRPPPGDAARGQDRRSERRRRCRGAQPRPRRAGIARGYAHTPPTYARQDLPSAPPLTLAGHATFGATGGDMREFRGWVLLAAVPVKGALPPPRETLGAAFGAG